MRLVASGFLLSAVFALPGTAGMHPAADLTVVLDFQGPHSEKSVKIMKTETQGILKELGVRLDWRTAGEASRGSYADLAVMRFKGACLVSSAPSLYDEPGPLAFTYRTDGVVQPFGEVECDKVSRFVRSAMRGDDLFKADQLLGRALGRVVAHELIHILSRSSEHGTEGVEKAALSSKQLIAGSLPLSPADVDRLRDKQNEQSEGLR